MEMPKTVEQLPEQILDGLNIKIKKQKEATNICIFNFDSSNIAAEIVSAYAFANSTINTVTVSDTVVPSWVNSKTDIVIMSYNNFSVQLENIYIEQKKRRCRIHCITSKGILADICKENRGNLILIPNDLDEIESLGFQIGALTNLFEQLGMSGIKQKMTETIPSLKKFRDQVWGPDFVNYINEIASIISDKIPVIYSISELKACHKRWRQNINIKLNRLAFSGVLPEFNHNEIVSWTEDKNNKDYIIIFLVAETESKLLNKIQDVSQNLLSEQGLNIYVAYLDGDIFERNIEGVLLQDAAVAHMKKLGY